MFTFAVLRQLLRVLVTVVHCTLPDGLTHSWLPLGLLRRAGEAWGRA